MILPPGGPEQGKWVCCVAETLRRADCQAHLDWGARGSHGGGLCTELYVLMIKYMGWIAGFVELVF